MEIGVDATAFFRDVGVAERELKSLGASLLESAARFTRKLDDSARDNMIRGPSLRCQLQSLLLA